MATESKDVWTDDLLGRRDEAQLLQGYLESVASPTESGDRGSFVLAVDAGYGEGKTFFLKRFARQLEVNHPVAYVDAWKDDLANDPLAAIVATLEDALRPYMRDEKVKAKFESVVKSAGRIGSVLAWGLSKRLAALAITEGAVDALSAAVPMGENSAGEARKIIGGAAYEALGSAPQGGSMSERLRVFREGRDAIDKLKASLEALIASLYQNSKHPPVFIVIDELDRCRPSYAVELLEVVKHLFDVPGMVFVLGMHAGQLAHSVGALYGTSFDGRGYLDRFSNRVYRLAIASTGDLLRSEISTRALKLDRVHFPPLFTDEFHSRSDGIEILEHYLNALGIRARLCIKFVDALSVVLTSTKNATLYGPYLVPLLASRIKH